jgi:signal transduction histidine kinase
MNSFIYSLIQPTIIFNVYDLKHKLIYTTRQHFDIKWSHVLQEPQKVSINSTNGLLLTQEVISRKTDKVVGYVQIFDDFKSWNALQNKLLLMLIVLELISLLVSACTVYFLSNYFLKPLKILHNTMQEVSSDPKSEKLMEPIKTNDELEDLANIFNEMLKRMRFYIKQQEQFVSDVSHELRTPVAIIQGQLSMLNRWGKDDPEVLDDAIKSSLQEINRMKELVSEMLALTRADQVDLHYLDQTTEVYSVVDQAVNNFRMLYPEFKINLKNNIDQKFEAKIYRNHLEQIVIIILDNAIKYSTDRKQIDLQTMTVDNEAWIKITDYGEGISQDELEKIFNRFYRVDKARARKKGGNGLGLAIAYKLMENYGGRIEVTSQVDQGTTFTLILKLSNK